MLPSVDKLRKTLQRSLRRVASLALKIGALRRVVLIVVAVAAGAILFSVPQVLRDAVPDRTAVVQNDRACNAP